MSIIPAAYSNPAILLHICCGPCATHPILMLKEKFSVTGFFFNPNIFPPDEYQLRIKEAEDFCRQHEIPMIAPDANRAAWLALTSPLSEEKEGGERCRICFRYRLEKTAQEAVRLGIPAYTTTLTIGPNKPAKVIFPIGHEVAEKAGVQFLEYDFKKQDGFKKSSLISKELGMYRQNYCGCEFSMRRLESPA
jgi:predicted adenine nucleotide alpha hydrolase (AANH) superfamily ATPase